VPSREIWQLVKTLSGKLTLQQCLRQVLRVLAAPAELAVEVVRVKHVLAAAAAVVMVVVATE
jgi:hypothetical protein